MSKIATAIEMEFKSLRIYWLQLLIVVFVMPFSYAFIILISGNLQGASLTYLLSGYIVATIISTFINMLGMRITNMRQQEVLELYSTYAISFPTIVISECLSYVLITLPIVLIVLGYIVATAQSIHWLLLICGVLLTIVFLLLFSVYLGLAMKNMFIANGLFQVITWVLILLAPIYYSFEALSPIFRGILLINPITHLLNMVRVPLGILPSVNLGYSYCYIVLLCLLASIYISKRINSTHILEKIF
jgi:ABC-2 type transport system permease protein